MCQLSPPGQSSTGADEATTHWSSSSAGIGELFRRHGESYIESYKPDRWTISLLRSIRICRTPALGGKRYTCGDCGYERYQYFSCGNSHCPLCQGNKRQAWYERVEAWLLAVPYCHITFTLPHEFNGLCRLYPKEMYGMFFEVVWKTLKTVCLDPQHVGGLPGVTMVLHTWGSDLKHHVHLHCLVTHGGLNKKTGQWVWPKQKDKLMRHRPLRSLFRANFLEALEQWMKAPEQEHPVYHQSYAVLTADVKDKTWVVNQQRPTANPEVINGYLSRYVCRIGISDNRVTYNGQTEEIRLEYKDYRHQKQGQAAPTAYRDLAALVAIHCILQHLLPKYFHRSRHYGLHTTPTRKRLASKLEDLVKSNPDTISLIFMLLRQMLLQCAVGPKACEHCGSVAAPTVAALERDDDYHRAVVWQGRSPPFVLARCAGDELKKVA